MEEKRDQNVTVRLTEEEVARIDNQAAAEDRDRSGLIRRAINEYLRTQGENQ